MPEAAIYSALRPVASDDDLQVRGLSPRSEILNPLTFVVDADISGPGRQLLTQQKQSPNPEELPVMAPAPRRELLAKEHFAFVFGNVKTQPYHDPAAKGPGSHTYVLHLASNWNQSLMIPLRDQQHPYTSMESHRPADCDWLRGPYLAHLEP
jgi:hypothetical protein